VTAAPAEAPAGGGPALNAAPARTRSLVVDARGLLLSGIGRYLREVVGGLLADPRFGRVLLLGRSGELREYLAGREGAEKARVVPFEHHFYSAAAQVHWAALRAGGALRADGAFFPHYDAPLPPIHRRSVVVVQDLAQFLLPEMFPAWKRALGGVVLSRAVARASRVVVSSESTRRDLLARHPHVAGRVVTIPLGVAHTAPVATEAALARVRALEPFLLCVGNRKPHKNLVAAVEVLARLRPRFPGLRLVLAGAGGDDGVAARSAALGVADGVTELGPVSEEVLAALYARAGVLLFPSLFEGFGLPLLEAMRAGVPVVSSNRASLPEVAGDAAVLADPRDADAFAAAAARLMEDAARRAEMVRRGLVRAGELTWARTARRTADLLWETLSG
jgi:glycosyltransferase involved in cell wall biosynthesis